MTADAWLHLSGQDGLVESGAANGDEAARFRYELEEPGGVDRALQTANAASRKKPARGY